MTGNYRELVDRFIRWGEKCDSLRAALVIGSQARADHRADENSDLDLLMIVDNPACFLSSDQWLKEIGDFFFSFTENTLEGAVERRVLFDNALDVDFVLFSSSNAGVLISGLAADILRRGHCILIDKIKLRDQLAPLAMEEQAFSFPNEKEFVNKVNDFWYHAVWTAKKLKRGELWTAKFCVDSHMKRNLLAMVECYAKAMHGAEYNTWHNGRFMEEWAEAWIVEKLSLCFSLYSEESIIAALKSTMGLYRAIAVEVAGMRGFSYPTEADAYAAAWVMAALSL